MKRFLILAALLLVPSLLFAVTPTQTHGGTGKIKTLTIDVTTDAAGGQERLRLELPEYVFIWYVETNPGSTAPTDDYDLAIYNEMGIDVMGGALNNRDTANSERAEPYIDSQYVIALPARGPFYLDQTNNAIANATYRVRIIYTE